MTTHTFNADITQLLNIIINALYSNKDVFLRELISNASDAIDKHRTLSLRKNIIKNIEDYSINVYTKGDYLIVSDNGIGMTLNEITNNLGTIAKSGTKSFIEKFKSFGGDFNQIGQFGVGFYSGFLVAENVFVLSKKENIEDEDECEGFNYNLWSSSGTNDFTTSEFKTPEEWVHFNAIKLDNETFTRGTKIVLKVKDEEKEYKDKQKIETIINKHSQFIKFPITYTSYVSKEIEVDKEPTEPTESKLEESEIQEEKPKEKEKKTVQEEQVSRINTNKPIWNRNRDEITKEEYNVFFKTLSGKSNDSLYYKHFRTEGKLEYDCIVYIPPETKNDMFSEGQQEKSKNFKLYCNGVFVLDDCEQLVPEWLRFVYGIIDCKNIQLNVSRETLQDTNLTKSIKDNILTKSIDVFIELKNNKDEYVKFYKNFEKNIKLGVHSDTKNREKLMSLLQYKHLNNLDVPISLDDYLKDNDKIYFLSGQNLECVVNSPYLELYKQNKKDVLLMVDPLDEFILSSVTSYKDKTFVSLSKNEATTVNNDSEDTKKFFTYVKKVLGKEVENVVSSSLLTSTPCIVTTSSVGWSANLERILKAQALRDNTYDSFMQPKKIFEFNTKHNLIVNLVNNFANNGESTSLSNKIELLFNASVINAGFTIENTQKVTNNIFNFLCENCNEVYNKPESVTLPASQDNLNMPFNNDMFNPEKFADFQKQTNSGDSGDVGEVDEESSESSDQTEQPEKLETEQPETEQPEKLETEQPEKLKTEQTEQTEQPEKLELETEQCKTDCEFKQCDNCEQVPQESQVQQESQESQVLQETN